MQVGRYLVGSVIVAMMLMSRANAGGHELAFYVDASFRAGSETTTLKLDSGESLVVALPPVAIIHSQDVVGARVMKIPVEFYDQPPPGVPHPQLHRVVLDLKKDANDRLQTAFRTTCGSTPGLSIALDEIIVGYITVTGCSSPLEAGSEFWSREKALEVARRFTKNVRIVEPTPSPTAPGPVSAHPVRYRAPADAAAQLARR